MTDVTAGRLRKVIVHPLTVRITHWVNALAMVIMIMSGWRIYNSEPILPFHFPIALTLGGSFDGSVDLHNEDGLAGALQWHFAGMWLPSALSHSMVSSCSSSSSAAVRLRSSASSSTINAVRCFGCA